MVRTTPFSLAALAIVTAAVPAVVVAQPGPQVNVTIGPELQRKTPGYGDREVRTLQRDLREQVARAISRGRNRVDRVDIVLEDATPNRPTFEQLGRNTGLSARSVGLGGARLSGVVYADGRRLPFRFGWYETDLRNERGATTWSDAYRAFGMLAGRIARGDLPQSYGPSARSPGTGNFGDWRGR
jgi:hypothetical protein